MVVVFGSGISGLGACELLDYLNIEYVLLDDNKECIEENVDYIIKSPGVPWTSKYISKMKDKVLIISEIEFAIKYLPKDIFLIGITGTNGKTTTATKTYEILKENGYLVALAGNVGYSLSKLTKKILSKEEKITHIVLELSSYQLENNEISLDIAAITNLTPDHLARYKDLNDYYMTKMNIVKNIRPNGHILINEDDKTLINYFTKVSTNSKIVYLSKKKELLFDKKKFSLKGDHNLENLLFVIEIAKILNISNDKIEQFLYTTKTLSHRMEEFYKYKGLTFINDSKGTNVESTIKAIRSYEDDIILIIGGEDKKIDNLPLAQEIKKQNILHTYIFGANKDILEKDLKSVGYKEYTKLNDIYEIANDLKKFFNKKAYVLFSPATASFDQFKNFEDRGEKFKSAIIEVMK